jgi:hypothetical protein
MLSSSLSMAAESAIHITFRSVYIALVLFAQALVGWSLRE